MNSLQRNVAGKRGEQDAFPRPVKEKQKAKAKKTPEERKKKKKRPGLAKAKEHKARSRHEASAQKEMMGKAHIQTMKARCPKAPSEQLSQNLAGTETPLQEMR